MKQENGKEKERMKEQEGIIYIDTEQLENIPAGLNLYGARKMMMERQQSCLNHSFVSIVILAYNRLDKTKQCVESVLKHTKEIDYELILVDNGSSDGTLDYFKKVPYKKKSIICITKPMGTNFAFCWLSCVDVGRYVVFLANDLICTPNWLKNLLTCMESDERIGMVNPVSSNVSNFQEVSLSFSSIEEMEEKAELYNQSDSRKWEERLRLITLGSLFRTEALMSIGFPIFDAGFLHDFGDDDLSFRLRRNGYRLILATDTWIHHNHDFRNFEDKKKEQFIYSLNLGREQFQKKYFEVDSWEDTIVEGEEIIRECPVIEGKQSFFALGIDVKCGSPLLELKNHLRSHGMFDVQLDAFVQESKYREDLCSICNGTVVCDREEGLRLSFPKQSYDYVILGKPLNSYNEPWVMLEDSMERVREGGYLIVSLENAFSYLEFFHILGRREIYRRDFVYPIPYEECQKQIEQYGTLVSSKMHFFTLPKDEENIVRNVWEKTNGIQSDPMNFCHLLTKKYLFIVQKQDKR